MAKTVVLDAGHGGHDPGAQSGGLREKDLTLDIVKRTINKLKKYNVKVIATRTTDKFISLSGRASIANRNKADLFVSVHINSGGGTGFESFIYNGAIQSSTKSLQNAIHSNVVKKLNVRDRGKKRANFAVVRETRMPAVLTENLFIDGDNALLKKSSTLDKIAQGHADGIAEFLGLKKSSGSKPSNTSKKPSSKPKKSKDKGVKWVGTNQKGKRVESIYKGKDGLNYYDGPRWNNPSGTFGYGQGWKVDNLYRVDGSLMYRVQNSKGKLFYITASSKYVKVVGGKSKASKPKTSYKVGSTVTLKKSASKFATGQSILNSAKGKKYKIIQVKSDRVLLDGIMSWVKKSDVQ